MAPGAVEHNGGRVVKGLGDGLMATYASASDAVASAVRMQQAIERANRTERLAAQLSVRVGISSGDVTWEDGDCFGNAVVEASRICDFAEGGEILVSEATRLLAAGRSGEDWLDRGPVKPKGLDHDVHLWSVTWTASVRSLLELPPDVVVAEEYPFTGRGSEMAALKEAWQRAVSGQRQIAWISGEAGIGKSRTARELARMVHDDGGLVLYGRSDEDFQLPFQPFSEVLDHWVQQSDRGEVLAVLGQAVGDLEPLVPRLRDIGSSGAGVDPATERFRLLQAVVGWFETMAETSPVLLVLEDLHWTTQPTGVMLRHLLRRRDLPMMVAGTFRPVAHGHPLGSVLAARDADVTTIELEGLSRDDVRDLIGAVDARISGDESLVDAIWRRSDGNPFFLGEILREVREREEVTAEEIQALGSTAGLRQMVGDRLATLSDAASDLLAVGSIVGGDIDIGLLTEVCELSEGALLDAVDETAESGLTEEVGPGTIRFTHDLLRESVVSALSATRRARLHRRVADGLERMYADAPDGRACEIAHHRLQAAGPDEDDPELLGWIRRAGDCCMEAAPEEAVRWYREYTTRHREPDADRVDVLIALGAAQRRSGDATYRHSLMEAALLSCREGRPKQLARAAVNTNRGFATRAFAVDEEITGVLRLALESMPDTDGELRAELMSSLATELVFADDSEERERLAQDALDMARRVGDPLTLSNVLVRWAHVNWHPGTARRRLQVAYELEDIAEASKPLVTQPGSELAFCAAFELGMRDEADAWMRRWQTALEDLCGVDIYVEFLSKVCETALAIFDAEYDRARVLLAEVTDLGEAGGDPDWDRYTKALTSHLWYDTGTLHEFLGPREVSSLTGDNEDDDIATALLARALFETGDHGAARATFDRYLAALPYTDRPLNVVWAMHILVTAELVADLGLVEHAEPLYALLSPFAGVYPTLPPSLGLGSVDHALGRMDQLAGRSDRAKAHFEEALRIHDSLRGSMWMARSRLELASAITGQDDIRAARLREEAHALIEAHGLEGLRPRMDILAAAVGPSLGPRET